MPKKSKTSLRQPSLLPKRPIPKMPEGYYSSGPNPNLHRFVEEHATPYDPVTDNYKVKPFDKPITTTKATAIYNMHTYWSKKPHDAIREYIKHYTQPGDIVLDPFCGSGGTALAALMEGRVAIAIDLSPAATFITKNYCTPVDVDELQRAFDELQRKVKPEMDWLYETRCDRCDGRATTAYTVYSYVFQCPRCLEKVALFDCPEVNSQTGAGKPKTIRICPSCQAHGQQEEIKTSGVRFDPVPVLVSYLCEEGCKPQRGERRHNDPDPKKHEYFEKYDLGKIKELEAKPIPYWYPPHRMMNVESDTEPWGDEWRPGRDFRTVAELFTKRNLWALAALFHEISSLDQPIRDALRFTLSSFLLNLSSLYKHRDSGGGQPTGNYYVPQIHRENGAWAAFERKYADIKAGLQELSDVLENINVLVSTQSALSLSGIPDETIDHIFTDPPYAGKFQYGELNFVWEAWLDLDTHWHNGEVIVNETREVTDDDWARMMLDAMCECYRVLKPGRWIALCYHDTSEGTWSLVQDVMAQVGFIADHAENTLYIDTGQKTYNQTQAEKVTQRDLVINFRKPYPGEITGQLTLFDASDFATFQEAARAVLVEALTNHPGSTADRLYDELVSRLVRKGQFERHDFDEVLRSVAEPVSEPRMANLFEKEQPNFFGTHEVVRWYLQASADVVDEAESAKEIAAARRLETFMARYMVENPEEVGVHYSDLFEQYLPVKDKPRRLLQEWLPEFFFKTSEGTWRPPANDQERAQLAALRSSGLLRRVKRFGNALLQGVPPHERDKPESPITLADWVRQCRRAGLYEIGRVLYEKSGIKFDGLDEVALVELEEDYQVCVRRSEVKPAKKKKLRQGELFEDAG
jgi:16S rRNA G966 N2-methylase RsmD